MTEITDAIRAGVLGALSRGMSLDYAARADGIRVAEAEDIARAAGWPDDPRAVLAEYRRLTGTPAVGDFPAGFREHFGIGVEQAEREYFGEAVATGPTPEHLEPLESYVARVAAPIEASLTAELGMPGVRVEFDTRPLLEDPAEAEPLVWDRTELIEEEPLPPATDNPPRRPKKPSPTVPCEACGRGVLKSWVMANGGIQRHGHCRDGSA